MLPHQRDLLPAIFQPASQGKIGRIHHACKFCKEPLVFREYFLCHVPDASFDDTGHISLEINIINIVKRVASRFYPDIGTLF